MQGCVRLRAVFPAARGSSGALRGGAVKSLIHDGMPIYSMSRAVKVQDSSSWAGRQALQAEAGVFRDIRGRWGTVGVCQRLCGKAGDCEIA